MPHFYPGPHLAPRELPNGGAEWLPSLTVSVFGGEEAILVLMYNSSPNTYEVDVFVPGLGILQPVNAIPNSLLGNALPTTYPIPVPPGVYQCFLHVTASPETTTSAIPDRSQISW